MNSEHALIQKVLSEWSNFDKGFLVDEMRVNPHTTLSRPSIGPPAKRHLNGVSLACR